MYEEQDSKRISSFFRIDHDHEHWRHIRIFHGYGHADKQIHRW